MWESLKSSIISWINELIDLLNINQEKITQLSIDWAKAIVIIFIWFIIWRVIYTQTLRIFKKYKLKEKIDRFEDFLETDDQIKEESPELVIQKKLTERMKVDVVVAKSFSYYVFLFFFKQALLVLWITEVADSLKTLLNYLPSLFVGIVIWFFGIRFANFVYDVTYHTLSIAESHSKNKTSKIIATWSKGLILFLTVTLVLNFTKIIDQQMIYIILIGFISMISLAGGLAFGLGWKEMAKNILDKFNSEE